jgi:hypothetical protein
MLTNFFSRGLSLEIGGKTITFNSLADFEFSLNGRTNVPSSKLADLAKKSPQELKQEAKSIKAVEKRFVEFLSRDMEDSTNVSTLLHELDFHIFSQDHGWRDIMISLSDKNEDYNELKKLALVKYMQYLTSRQELIKLTYSNLRQHEKRAERESGERPQTNSSISDSLPKFKETVVLDSSIVEVQPPGEENFTRMPKGESVLLPFSKGKELKLLLSKHNYRLIAGDTLTIVDDEGHKQSLQEGKNIIGRDNVCNVILENSYRDISRLHLIIERLDNQTVRMTDLSSHGTYLPANMLNSAIVNH